MDHCRIGSLENSCFITCACDEDHCRIGSLERANMPPLILTLDHCRIGSLEINLIRHGI